MYISVLLASLLLSGVPNDQLIIKTQSLDSISAQAPDATAAKASANRKRVRKPAPRQTEEPLKDKKSQGLTRPTLSQKEQAMAEVPNMPGVRFWADSIADFKRALPPKEGPWLVLSSGGDEGAFGAGLFNGWTESGTRPNFSVITGVSTGALMATYVFAGPKYDAELRKNYTTITAGDIFEISGTPESLVDTWPLARLISKRVTPELLADIAEQHKQGRRLFVLTTNLDAGRSVIWNMGAIAAHGNDTALKLFHDVLLASASIPGEFPPVYIDVEAGGHKFKEMHVDGGTNGPLFIAPEPLLTDRTSKELPTKELYIVINGKLAPDFNFTSRSTAAILGRSIVVALKMGARLQLALGYELAQRSGAKVYLAYIESTFDQNEKGAFDSEYMNSLFEHGRKKGLGNDKFYNKLPFPAANLTSSGAEKKANQ